MEILGQSTKTITPRPYTHLGYLAACGRESAMFSFVAAIILFLVAVSQLFLGKVKSSIVVFVLGFFFLIGSFVLYLDDIPRALYERNRGMSERNLKNLNAGLQVYAQHYNGKLPTPELWCDVLISEAEVDPECFISLMNRHSEENESAYALNKHVIGMKLLDIPPDAVLLFETNLGFKNENNEKKALKRWNQIGSLQDITTFYDKEPGACVLFGDGHVEFVHAADIDSLKWTIEDSETPLGAAGTQ